MQEKVDPFQHAIIIGGSFSGMLAAKILSKYFARVTIIERASLVEIEKSENIPQKDCLHVLSAIGFKTLRKLFPEFEAAILAKGAYPIDYPDEVLIYDSGWKPKLNRSTGKNSTVQSRKLVDETIRDLIKKVENISFLYDSEVCGLLSHFKEIYGVNIINKITNEKTNLHADFVVDASGYHSLAPDWLNALGYVKPIREEVEVNVYGLYQYWRWPESLVEEWRILRIKGKSRWMGVVTQVEDDAEGKKWCIALTTLAKENFENHESEFTLAAQGLDNPLISNLIKQGTPLSPIYRFAYRANSRYSYKTMKQLPKGFLAIGDALFSTNPRLGLGLSDAILSADILDQVFAQKGQNNLDRITKEFFRKFSKFSEKIWPIAVQNSSYSSRGEKTTYFGLMNWYLAGIDEISSRDAEVWDQYWSVIKMEKPFFVLLRPSYMVRVLWNAIKRR